jgi:hypothetical protein
MSAPRANRPDQAELSAAPCFGMSYFNCPFFAHYEPDVNDGLPYPVPRFVQVDILGLAEGYVGNVSSKLQDDRGREVGNPLTANFNLFSVPATWIWRRQSAGSNDFYIRPKISVSKRTSSVTHQFKLSRILSSNTQSFILQHNLPASSSNW